MSINCVLWFKTLPVFAQRSGYLLFFTRLLLISCYVIRIFQTYKHSRPGNEFCCWKIWRPSRPINHVGSFTLRYALSPRTDIESPIENFEDAIRRRVTERGSVYKFKGIRYFALDDFTYYRSYAALGINLGSAKNDASFVITSWLVRSACVVGSSTIRKRAARLPRWIIQLNAHHIFRDSASHIQ